MSQFRKVHRIVAFLTFLIAFVVYFFTSYPSVTFGDSAELAAAAYHGQIPSDIGTHLWVVMGGALVKILPGDPAHILVLFSALCSALAAMFVCLIVMRLYPSSGLKDIDENEGIRDEGIRDDPTPEASDAQPLETGNTSFALPDSQRVEGPAIAGLIAGLSFAGFGSVWLNATTITNHSLGALIVAVVLWAGLSWYQANREEEPGRFRWLLLAGYVGGLAMGVDPLALAALVVLGILIWIGYSENRFSPEWTLPITLGGGAFFLLLSYALMVWGGTIKFIAISFIDAQLGISPAYMLVPFVLFGIIYKFAPHLRNVSLSSGLLLLLLSFGYTTYSADILRWDAGPAMRNQSSPTRVFNFDRTGSSRERHLADSIAAAQRGPSFVGTSIANFYPRYFYWNVIGRENDSPDSPVAWFTSSESSENTEPSQNNAFPVRFFALPLLLALAGMIFHYRRDWKTAFAVTLFFVVAGPLTFIVLKGMPIGTDTGGLIAASLIPIAIWIGLGAHGFAEAIRDWSKKNAEDDSGEERGTNLANGIFVLCLFAAPVNLLYSGYNAHNHSGNSFAIDYAYNLLQSTEPNAILMVTKNEAGLIHYLQGVQGIRRDVRMVDLSLITESLYLNQLESEKVWNADTVLLRSRQSQKFSFELGYHPVLDTAEKEERKGVEETEEEIGDSLRTITSGRVYIVEPFNWGWNGYPVDSGAYLRTVPHQVIADIVRSQMGRHRPVYFSMNVSSHNWIGLEQFFRWEGLAFRVDFGLDSLQKVEGFSEFQFNQPAMLESIISVLPSDEYSPTPNRSFMLSRLNAPEVTNTPEERKVIPLYRRAFLALAADALKNRAERKECLAVLDRMDKVLPPYRFPLDYWTSAVVASLYNEAGNIEGAKKYAQYTLERIKQMGERWQKNGLARRYNPYQVSAQMYVLLGDYNAAIESYQSVSKDWITSPVLRGLVEELRVEQHLRKGDTAAAANELRKIISGYGSTNKAAMQANLNAWEAMFEEMGGESE